MSLGQPLPLQWGVDAVKTKIATALILSFALADHAMAGWFNIVPKPTPVPEFDGSTGVAAIALLVSVVAVVFNRRRSRS